MKLRDWIRGLGALVLVLGAAALVLYGIFHVLRYLWHVFVALPNEVAVAVVAASATIFASAMAVSIGQYLQRRASIRQEIRKANAPIYQQWVDLWFQLMFAEKMGKPPLTEQEMVAKLTAFSQQMMLWGSDRAVREWVTLRLGLAAGAVEEAGDSATEASRQNMRRIAQFVRTIRRDMGHRNNKLDDATLLGMFINDAPTYFGDSKHA